MLSGQPKDRRQRYVSNSGLDHKGKPGLFGRLVDDRQDFKVIAGVKMTVFASRSGSVNKMLKMANAAAQEPPALATRKDDACGASPDVKLQAVPC
jgi:hypothetical protein